MASSPDTLTADNAPVVLPPPDSNGSSYQGRAEGCTTISGSDEVAVAYLSLYFGGVL